MAGVVTRVSRSFRGFAGTSEGSFAPERFVVFEAPHAAILPLRTVVTTLHHADYGCPLSASQCRILGFSRRSFISQASCSVSVRMSSSLISYPRTSLKGAINAWTDTRGQLVTS